MASPNRLTRAALDETLWLAECGIERIGHLNERDLLLVGTALDAAEGAKGKGAVIFANTDPRMIALFLRWLRTFFVVDESRVRARLYLHADLDIRRATAFGADLTGIPTTQFHKPYRAVVDATRRKHRHLCGCLTVRYSSTTMHREVMGLVGALLAYPGGNPG